MRGYGRELTRAGNAVPGREFLFAASCAVRNTVAIVKKKCVPRHSSRTSVKLKRKAGFHAEAGGGKEQSMERKLDGKVAIVTGGGSGIGKGIAAALLKEGASVVITGRTVSRLKSAETELAGLGRVKGVAGDGAKEEDVLRTVKGTVDAFGRIDILVNNAHSSKPGVALADTTMENLQLSMGSGFLGTFFFMKHCFPYLRESRGRVINFGSGAAINGQVGQSAYAAAKEAIRGLSRVAVNEWGPLGITINIILPFAETPGMLKWKTDMPDAYAASLEHVPLRKLAEPEGDVGRLVVFLASDDARAITGQTIGCDGGASMRP